MMEKFMSYSSDTLTMFTDWVMEDSVAFTFVALIVMCSVVALAKQLLD